MQQPWKYSSLVKCSLQSENKLAAPVMESILNEIFNTYNPRNFQEFATERKRTICYDLETSNYRYPQPASLKEINSLSEFKRRIKHWICSDYPYGVM